MHRHIEENDGLLLQFIFKELEELDRIFRDKDLSALEIAERLAGKSLHDMRIFAWSVENGPMTQLRYYAALFGKKEVAKSPFWKQFEKCLSKLWLYVLKALEPSYSKKGAKRGSLIEKMHMEARLLIQNALEVAGLFSENENVLYYLARHKESIASFLEKGAVRTFFEKNFPSIEKAEEFVVCRYQERSFHELLPEIHRCFQNL